VVLATA